MNGFVRTILLKVSNPSDLNDSYLNGCIDKENTDKGRPSYGSVTAALFFFPGLSSPPDRFEFETLSSVSIALDRIDVTSIAVLVGPAKEGYDFPNSSYGLFLDPDGALCHAMAVSRGTNPYGDLCFRSGVALDIDSQVVFRMRILDVFVDPWRLCRMIAFRNAQALAMETQSIGGGS